MSWAGRKQVPSLVTLLICLYCNFLGLHKATFRDRTLCVSASLCCWLPWVTCLPVTPYCQAVTHPLGIQLRTLVHNQVGETLPPNTYRQLKTRLTLFQRAPLKSLGGMKSTWCRLHPSISIHVISSTYLAHQATWHSGLPGTCGRPIKSDRNQLHIRGVWKIRSLMQKSKEGKKKKSYLEKATTLAN